MAIHQWSDPSSVQSLLTTELNALADGGNKIVASGWTNGSQNYLYGRFKLKLAVQGAARDAGAYVKLYLLPYDGTDYAYGGDSLDPSSNHHKGSFKFDATTAAQIDMIEGIVLPQSDFKALVMQETGEAFAATLNILSFEAYNTESV